ncbi:gasdermin-C-like [Octodon degus]|uniref:Gasdermin-C-like n=1 Tax=Octodon degus TaxID=10160 RepID=A0A6P6EQH6_OCTDE|nr:gasdermin-C-like [Octodon degus]
MPSIFERASKNMIKNLGGKDMVPVTCALDANKFHQLSIILKRSRFLIGEHPEDIPVGYSLMQILEPSSSVPDSVISGPLITTELEVNKLKADVSVKAAVEVSASGDVAWSHGSTIEVQSVSISNCDLEILQNRKLLDPEPSFLSGCRRRGDNLYVVTEAVELIKDTILRDNSNVAVSGKASIPQVPFIKAESQGQGQRETTMTVPQGTVMAYRKKKLVIKDKYCSILVINDTKQKTFQFVPQNMKLTRKPQLEIKPSFGNVFSEEEPKPRSESSSVLMPVPHLIKAGMEIYRDQEDIEEIENLSSGFYGEQECIEELQDLMKELYGEQGPKGGSWVGIPSPQEKEQRKGHKFGDKHGQYLILFLGIIEEPFGQNFSLLEEEVSGNMEALAQVSKDRRDVIFHSIVAMLGDRETMQMLMDTWEMETLGHLDGPGGKILDELRQGSSPSWINLEYRIFYLLEVLMVLSDTQLFLLAQSVEKRIMFQQRELVRSILAPNFKYPWHIPFTIQAELLAPLQEAGLHVTYALLEECGLKMELESPRSTWHLEAKRPLSALYGALSLLLQLAEA